MTTHKYTIQLSRKVRTGLHHIIHRGNRNVRVVTRARILLMTHEGKGKDAIAQELNTNRSTVQRIRDHYRDGGLARALYDAPRPGQPRKLDTKAEAHLIALACTDPPTGANHWTLELLQEQMIKDKQVRTISSVAIMHYLHRNDTKPWREKNVVYSSPHR